MAYLLGFPDSQTLPHQTSFLGYVTKVCAKVTGVEGHVMTTVKGSMLAGWLAHGKNWNFV
jgi:hypothetical protein